MDPRVSEKLIQLQAKINKLEIYLQRERELNHVCQVCGFMNKHGDYTKFPGITGWIRCSDLLPDPGVDVLVLDKKRRTVSIRHSLDHREAWNGSWGIGFTSHWMPIPEIPTQTKENKCV